MFNHTGLESGLAKYVTSLRWFFSNRGMMPVLHGFVVWIEGD